MAQKTASVSIAWDWDVKPANEGDTELMTAVRRLFSDVTVDCYGRDAETQVKLWIIQGVTVFNLRAFTMSLTELLPSFDIASLSFHTS